MVAERRWEGDFGRNVVRSLSWSTKSWRKYVANQPQCNFKVTEHPLTATFIHPGLNYSCFDRDGAVSVNSLLSLVMEVRTFAEYYPYKEEEGKRWFHWAEVERDRSIFMSSFELAVSRNIYNKQVAKWPVEAKVHLGYVGNSSLAFSLGLYAPGSQEPLLTHNIQMVGVDTKTRKPKPFPDWFLNKYKDQCLRKTGFRLPTFARPKKTFMYKKEVMWLDTDRNNHTNFASYVRYALDAIYSTIKHQTVAESTRKEPQHRDSSSIISVMKNNSSCTEHPSSSTDVFSISDDLLDKNERLHSLPAELLHTKASTSGLKGISKDIMKQGLKSLKVCYINECVEGEIIDVHIWQEENEPYIVKCSVEKEEQLICQIIFEYFGPLSRL